MFDVFRCFPDRSEDRTAKLTASIAGKPLPPTPWVVSEQGSEPTAKTSGVQARIAGENEQDEE